MGLWSLIEDARFQGALCHWNFAVILMFIWKNARLSVLLGLLAHSIAWPQEVVSFNALPTLPAITVQASRFEEKSTDALPQTSIVTANEIQSSGALSVSEIISKVVGLPTRINLDGSSNAVIDLRGYGDAADNNVVVLLDGVRISENEQASARTAMIPVEIIDHVEVTMAGNSVLYGDGATGGTINIVTKKNIDNLTILGGGVSSYSGYQSSIFHARELGASQLSIFGKGLNSDGYREGSTTKERSAGLNLTHAINTNSLVGVRLINSQENNTLPGPLPSLWLNSSPTRSSVPGYHYGTSANASSITVYGTKKINSIEFLIDISKREKSFDTNYRYNASNVYSGYSPTLSVAPLAPVNTYARGTSAFSGSVESINPRIKVSNFLLPNNSLIVGVDRLHSRRDMTASLTSATRPDTENASASQTDSKTQGFYFRNDWRYSPEDRWTIGYRTQNYSTESVGTSSWNSSGSTYASELQYSRKFNHYFVGFMRAGQNFRLPNVDDNSSVNWDENGQPILLVPQVSHDIDVGLNYQSANWFGEFKIFKSMIKNEIAFDPSVNWSYGGNVNYDPTKREGFSIRQSYRHSPQWDVKFNVHYVKAEFTENQYAGKTVPNVARYHGNIALGYQLSGPHKFTLSTRFASNKFASGDFVNNQEKIPGYAVQDLSYLYSRSNFTLLASINNILNKQYTDLGVYKPIAGSGEYYYIAPYNMTVYPNSGRNFNLIGRYSF